MKQRVAEGEAAPLTEMFQLTGELFAFKNSPQINKIPTEICAPERGSYGIMQNHTRRDFKNKSFKYILKTEKLNCLFVRNKHFYVDKYSHISSSALQQIKDEV